MIIPSAIENARKFLIQNPTEKKITAARIFNIKPTTLNSAISRDAATRKKGGINKIMADHEETALRQYVLSLLTYGILPTYEVVFNAIVGLKRAQNVESSAPTRRWFRNWWKQSGLHKIKIKPLPVIRFEAAEEKDIVDWFKRYRMELKALNIRTRRNVINFDEGGFRLGCLKGQEILVPTDMHQFYSTTPDNRKSVSIIEMINAAGDFPTPPLVIISGQEIMASWYNSEQPEGTMIIPSSAGFTSDQIALEFLKHYIKHSNAGPEAEWKLMLMDNHGSHMTSEFRILANDHNIRPFTFIPHLTHCMQPLDVKVFQKYKHNHQKAIQEAVAESFVEYSLHQFLRDLAKIRINTFKASTIRHAFEESGMWPVNAQKCIKNLKVFNPDLSNESPLPTLLPRHFHPQQIADVEHGLEKWGTKIRRGIEWSDPARGEEFDSFVAKLREVITNSIFKESELQMWHDKRLQELHGKRINRKRLRPQEGLGLTKEDAMKEIAAKLRKEEALEKKRVENNFMKMWRMERDDQRSCC